ncbi:hypothetical protein I3843_12G110700 [Carya illinoinensis]|nr:hypothetical protein I3843_12G110700 [Carya illinoinensis]
MAPSLPYLSPHELRIEALVSSSPRSQCLLVFSTKPVYHHLLQPFVSPLPLLLNYKLKISCFRHEGFASEAPKTEYVQHYLPDESVNSEIEKSCTSKRDWVSNLRELAKPHNFITQV